MTLVEELDRLLWDTVRNDPLSQSVERGEITPEGATSDDVLALIVPGLSLCFRLFSANREAVLRLASEIDNLKASYPAISTPIRVRQQRNACALL